MGSEIEPLPNIYVIKAFFIIIAFTMNQLNDLEELIDLSFLCVSQSSQGPIVEVLDKMCDVMMENNLAIDNVVKTDQNVSSESTPKGDVDLDDFECILASTRLINSVVKGEDSIASGPNMEYLKEEAVPNDNIDAIDLDEFKSIFVTEALSNDCIEESEIVKEVTNSTEGLQDKNNVGADSNEFQSIIATWCLDSDSILDECALNDRMSHTQIDNSDIENISSENVIDSDKFICSGVRLDNNYLADIDILKNNTSDTISIEPYQIPVEFDKLGAIRKRNATKELFVDDSNDSDDGYNSSDFEFITEDEASIAGIVTKLSNITDNHTEVKTSNRLMNAGPSTSKTNGKNLKFRNEGSYSDYVKYSKYRYKRCYREISEYHVIPEGEEYLDMFRGEFAPAVLNNLYFMANKNILPSVAMNVMSTDFFYGQAAMDDEENEKYKDEVNDCRKMIVARYPDENRKRRRGTSNIRSHC